jgi:putative hydrolase of the HAD superfamily
VLFDSGGVLMRPVGGRWNPRADFEGTMVSHFPELTEEQFAEAIAVGQAFLDTPATTPDYGDYLRTMVRHLGIDPTDELIAELQRPVDVHTILEVPPDVLPTLKTLQQRGIRMAVVSDSWAGLPELHDSLGLDGFFEAYAISEVLGCNKPDPRMYHHASEALGLPPSECLFLDDDPELVAAAIALGYHGRAVIRHGVPENDGVPSIATIDEILPLFED